MGGDSWRWADLAAHLGVHPLVYGLKAHVEKGGPPPGRAEWAELLINNVQIGVNLCWSSLKQLQILQRFKSN